ncbi:MAG: DUF1269 domain-containing protein [Pseudomonadota bacterium]|nr:MAG: DUF1269 domain-containing protein [Pseudomonadota bacterium]
MRRRLYFLLPNIEAARQAFRELLLARIDESHIHVMAREGTRLGDLPEATFLQKSDTVHGILLGLLLGGATGAVAGTVAVLFPPSGLPMGLGVILATSLIGAILGGWGAGVVGADVPSTRLNAFRDAVNHGQVLMIVDIPKGRVQEISRLVERRHPDADMRGLEPNIPAFP